MKLDPQEIGELATRAMQWEVFAAPKPGLVDRCNCGAHLDMDFTLFQESIKALAPHMLAFAQIGAESGSDAALATLFSRLRAQGLLAEQDMFRATRGVNTHKGMIFTFGLLSGAAGWLSARSDRLPTPDKLGYLSAAMTAGICRREYAGLAAKQQLSHGERTYLLYRTPGARGEAESGFRSLRHCAYPSLARLLDDRSRDLNDVLVQTLIVLLAEVDDTNILNRKGTAIASQAKQQARIILKQGGALTPAGRAAIESLDQDFIRQRISPGGCADLLAATLFAWMLGHPDRAIKM